MTSLPALLKESIERWSRKLVDASPLSQLARQGGITPRALALYLESLRYLFQHSQRNLALAARHSAALGLPDLARYFAHKVSEEQGHEVWASDDLTHLPATTLTNLSPAHSIVRLVQLQAGLIAQHPICFVVYAVWAEYFTVLVGDEWLDALSGCGYDRSQLTAVVRHVEADRLHAALGFNEIERLWTGQPDAAVLLDVITRASDVFEQFCEEVCREARAAA
jgi:hypothetical protein